MARIYQQPGAGGGAGTVTYGGTGGTQSNTTPAAFTSWGTKTGAARKVLTWDSSLGSPSWDYLSAVEILTPSEMLTFLGTIDAGTSTNREVGTALETAPIFTLTWQGDPGAGASIDIDGGEVAGGDYPFTTPSPHTLGTGPQFYRANVLGGTRIFTATGGIGAAKTQTFNYKYRRYAGSQNQQTVLSSAQVNALPQTDLTESKTWTAQSVNAGGTASVWYVVGTMFSGAPVFAFGTERAAFTAIGTNVAHSNQYGGTYAVDQWKSSTTGVGNVVLDVKTSGDWSYRRHFGSNDVNSGTLSDTQVKALAYSDLTSGKAITQFGTAGGTSRMWYVFNGTYTGAPVFAINNEQAAFTQMGTAISHVNQYSYTGTVDQWRSDTAGVGAGTLAVKTSGTYGVRRYMGPAAVGTGGTLTNAQVLALDATSAGSSDLTASVNMSASVNGTAGQNLWYVHHSALGSVGAFTLNGEIAKFNFKGGTFALTNDFSVAVGTTSQYVSENTAPGTATLIGTSSFTNRRIFMGPEDNGTTLSSTEILALDDTASGTSAIQGTWLGTYTVIANGTANFIYHCYPASFTGNPVYYIGGFETSFLNAGTTLGTNAWGWAESYQQWRSGQGGLGTTTVEVRAT